MPGGAIKERVKALQAAVASKDWGLARQESALAVEAKGAKPIQRYNIQLYSGVAFAGSATETDDAAAASAFWDQAEEHYKNATELADDKAPAWKGLFELYTGRVDAMDVNTEGYKPLFKKLARVAQTLRKLVPKGKKMWRKCGLVLAAQKLLDGDDSEAEALYAELTPASDGSISNPVEAEALTGVTRCAEHRQAAEREEQLGIRITRQLEKLAKRRAQASRGGSRVVLTPQQQQEREAEEKLEDDDIRRRVTLKLDSQLLAKDELDQLYRRLADASETCSNDSVVPFAKEAHRKLVQRQLARLGHCQDEAAHSKLCERIRAECDVMRRRHADMQFPLRVRLMIAAFSEEDGLREVATRLSELCEQENPGVEDADATIALTMTDPHCQGIEDSESDEQQLCAARLAKHLESYLPKRPQAKTLLAAPEPAKLAVPREPPVREQALSAPLIAAMQPFPALCCLARLELACNQRNRCFAAVKSTLVALNQHKVVYPHDPRASGARASVELTLAEAYVGTGNDQRLLAKGLGIFSKHSADESIPEDLRRRATKGLAHAYLLKTPPAYAEAERCCESLGEQGDLGVWALSQRGYIRLMRGRGLQAATKSSAAGDSQGDGDSDDCIDDSEARQLLEEAAKLLERAAQMAPKDALHLRRLGVVYWELGGMHRTDRKYSYNTFVRAAQVEPQHARPFAYLGLYTQTVLNNVPKATQCFQRALSIDAANKIAGVALCELYMKQAALSKARAVCEAASRADPRSKWAWTRLARLLREDDELDRAVISYQQALRVDTGAVMCWEELAETYVKLGKFAAALKSLERAIELDAARGTTDTPEHNHRLYQLADINLFLGLHKEAVAVLRGVVNEDEAGVSLATYLPEEGRAVERPAQLPLWPPALHLLARCFHAEAMFERGQNSYLAAAAALRHCLHVIAKCREMLASKRQASWVSLLKLEGDASTLAAELPVSLGSVSPSAVGGDNILAPLEARSEASRQSFRCADRAFAKALHVDPTCAALWADRGVASTRAARHAETQVGGASGEAEARAQNARARPCLKNALVIRPDSTEYWNGLAVACDHSEPARRHCLTKAVTVVNNVQAAKSWAYLGLHYLRTGELRLAQRALARVQAADPSEPALWLAQGVLSSSSTTKGAQSQAMACFQRSLELSPSLAAQVGLARTSYTARDLTIAGFHARKCVLAHPFDPAAQNLLGLICEHQGLATEALQSFATAEVLLEQQRQQDQHNNQSRGIELQELVRENKARALCTVGRPAEALHMYQQLLNHAAEHGRDPIPLLSALAQAQGNAGQAEHAAASLQHALGLLEQAMVNDDSSKASVVSRKRALLLQLCQLHLDAGDPVTGRGALLRSISEDADTPPSSEHYQLAMRILFSIGLRGTDEASCVAALDAMKNARAVIIESAQQQPDNQDLAADLRATDHARMAVDQHRAEAALAHLRGDPQRSRAALSKVVMCDPTIRSSWVDLGSHLLKSDAHAALNVTLPLHEPPQYVVSRPYTGGAAAAAATGGAGNLRAEPPSKKDAWPQAKLTHLRRLEVLARAYCAVGELESLAPPLAVRGVANDWAALVDMKDGDDDAEYEDGQLFNLYKNLAVQEEPSVASGAAALSARLVMEDPTRASSWVTLASSLHAGAKQKGRTGLLRAAVRVVSTAQAKQQQQQQQQQQEQVKPAYDLDISLAECLVLRSQPGDWARATQLLQTALGRGTLPPEEQARAWLAVGHLQVAVATREASTQLRDEALSAYRSALQIHPSAEAWEGLAELYSRMSSGWPGKAVSQPGERPCNLGALAAADECLKSALASLPAEESRKPCDDRAAMRLNLRRSRLYFYTQRYDESLSSADEALATQLGAASPAVHLLRGLALRKLRKWKDAEAAFNKALRLHEMSMILVHGEAGSVSGDKHATGDVATHRVPQQAGGALARLNLGQIKLREKAWEEAKEHIAAAHTHTPTLSSAWQQLAVQAQAEVQHYCRKKKGEEPEDAQERQEAASRAVKRHLQAALHLNPSQSLYWEQLRGDSKLV